MCEEVRGRGGGGGSGCMRFVGAGGTNVNVVWFQADSRQLFWDFLAVIVVVNFVVTVVVVVTVVAVVALNVVAVVVSCFAAAFLGSLQRARDDATCDFNFNSDFDLEFWTLAPVCRRIGLDWISLATQAGRQGGRQAGS